MIKLYCFPRSGNSREVKLVLAEKGIPFEPINVRAEGFDRESPDFKKASPGGKVPAIIDGPVYMSEAYQINEYLDQKYPQKPILPPDAASRGKIREWVAVYDKRLALKIGLLLIECLLKPKPDQKEETKAKLRTEITEALKEVNAFLEGKEYLFGEYSLADVSMTPHVAALPRANYEIPAEFKNVRAWIERLKARPNFEPTAG